MSVQERRARERAERHRLIIRAARELAEAEGWDAVTTRRLAERIEYSQPVLYSHFKGKDAIVEAVAVEGFGELAVALRKAAEEASTPVGALSAVVRAYAEFADHNPVLYDAMFARTTDLPFGRPDTPEELHAAFAGLLEALGPLAGGRDPGTFTELGWSALHGFVTLHRDGRLPPEHREQRLTMLIETLAGGGGAGSEL
ncbi:MAG TPA: TetR/AcrR family transcriptional regulator [Amycolatopsis sp.]|uniref:TetR/AcrR family transcriptional regulator n=1 Tax=Amycolatopsis sp. TaxID=37632 RepID=UPI002B48A000|nr:TetR/AcrR family transcriptional regulator [Amycolatopsis sp.]HKS49079.1 TetR/AcrR family transcriptional regulator [Amycolatopsis sp.]